MLNKESSIGVSSRSFCKSKSLRDALEKNFNNIVYNEDLLHFDEEGLINFLRDCRGAIISEDPLTASVIDALPELKIVCKFGVGLDNIDVEHLKRKNINLGWKPGLNASSVAELALSYIILMLREACQLNKKLLNNQWKKVANSRDLSNTTVGIIGYGHIGKKLASYLAPHDCTILIYDPFLSDESDLSGQINSVSLEYLLENSDAISIHTPLNDSSRDMIDKAELSKMKVGSVLINLARGGIVNEFALYEHLKSGHLGGAAFDVFENEPNNTSKFLSKLIDLDNFFCTPHIAGTSVQTIERLGQSSIDFLKSACKL